MRRVGAQIIHPPTYAPLAELADALASGASGRKAVEVQILWGAPFRQPTISDCLCQKSE